MKKKKKDNGVSVNIKTLTIVTIIIVIFTISFGIYCIKSHDNNRENILKNNYLITEDGDYRKYTAGSLDDEYNQDKMPYRVEYIIIKKDYSKISRHMVWRVDNEDTYINQFYDFEYTPVSNIAKGSFNNVLKDGTFNFYSVSYDFNNGKFICNAKEYECNMYVQDLMDLKEEYYSLIKDSK